MSNAGKRETVLAVWQWLSSQHQYEHCDEKSESDSAGFELKRITKFKGDVNTANTNVPNPFANGPKEVKKDKGSDSR